MYHPVTPIDNDALARRTTSFLYSRGLCGLDQVVVTASAGVVTLCGRLPSPEAKRLCLECCRRVAGVLGVVDQLSVASPANDEAVAPKAAEASAGALRVLIADRDEMLLETYERFLVRRDMQVSFARNGLECIACLREVHPDILVLDPSLLWGGGTGVLARMYGERNLPTVPVIVLATSRDADSLSAVLEFPIDAFMAKPVSSEQLLKKIRWVRYSHGPNSRWGRVWPRAAEAHQSSLDVFTDSLEKIC